MIVNVGGKALAFGMSWQAILQGGGAGLPLDVQSGADGKAPVVWMAKNAVFMGVLAAEDVAAELEGSIYAAALAFARFAQASYSEMSGGVAAFIFDFGPEAGHVFIGIAEGRPRQHFDVAGLNADQARQVAQRFLDTTGARHLLVFGNVDIGGPSMNWREAAPADLAEAADSDLALRQMRGFVDLSRLRRFLPLVLAAALGLWWFHKHPFHKAAPVVQESVADRYLDLIIANGALPVVGPIEIARWQAGLHSIPVGIGGWTLSRMSCNAVNGQLPCVLTYVQRSDLATNKTFFDRKPPNWTVTKVEAGANPTITVTVPSPDLGATPLSTRYQHLPDSKWLLVDFTSRMQQAKHLTTNTVLGSPTLFGVLPGVAQEDIPRPVKMANWSLEGPARDLGLLTAWPSNIQVNSITLKFGDTGTQISANSSPITMTATGVVYVRD